MKYLLLFILFQTAYSQSLLLSKSDVITLPTELQSKIQSGMLVHRISEKIYRIKQGENTEQNQSMTVVIYFQQYPSADEIKSLADLNITLYPATWTPPVFQHPYGFMIATLPVNKFIEALSLPCIVKMGSGEEQSYPLNNEAARKIKADSVWAKGYTGTGIKVAILDSGLDTDPTNSDLPATLEKKDYSNYPNSIDTVVENTVTGHGTHVTGSVLGRGTLSAGNTGNGGGTYKGMAYNANLVFLKIGSDASGGASNSAEIAAMHAAVDTFNAKIVSMSYGGWGDYHDGTSSAEQAANWVVSRGVPFFVSAGNNASAGRHYSGTVNANDSTGFIRINVTGAGTNETALYMNLVWYDSTLRKNLSVKYYNSSQVQLSPCTLEATTESSRGTESQYSYYDSYLPAGSGTYYMRVFNASSTSQFFHVYEVWGNGKVKFNSPDPYYTIAEPAGADSVCAVAAWVSRSSWTDYNNSSWSYGYTLNDIAPFSSRGPRVDGAQKPDIAAPGSVVISIRDRDVYTTANSSWVDNDGTIPGGNANYYVMQGTSMACPVTAGGAALIMQRYPNVNPLLLYNAIKSKATTDSYTGAVPNSIWGYGKLNVNNAIEDNTLPVELTSFSASSSSGKIILNWSTATEINNAGFVVERSYTPQNIKWDSLAFIAGQGNSNHPISYSFTDIKPGIHPINYYRLKQIDADGSTKYSVIVSTTVQPIAFALAQNYPNPFNPSTTIQYSIAKQGMVSLKLYDILGNEVQTLVSEEKAQGNYSVEFNAADLSSGVYFYTMRSGGFVASKKMIVLK